MSTAQKPKRVGGKNTAPVKTRYIVANLRCQRCASSWLAVDLNEHRKTVFCPTCGENNSITGAMKNA
jgi:predicted RNA-binding Zn-ribbon protein involved in translation (DUF1610 family)